MPEKSASASRIPASTSIFRMRQGIFLRLLVWRHGRLYAIGAAAIMAGLVLTSVITLDVRFAILALMTLFIVIPMIAALLYINYALSPLRAFNTLPHRLVRGRDGVVVEIFANSGAGEEKSEVEDVESGEGDVESRVESGESRDKKVGYEQVGRLEIPYEALQRYYVGLDSLIIPVEDFGKGAGFIYLPKSEIEM